MKNTLQSRLLGISHFFIALGLFLVSIMVLQSIASNVVQSVFGLDLATIEKVKAEDLTVSQLYGLKVYLLSNGLSFVLAAWACTRFYRKKLGQFTGLSNRPSKFALLAAMAIIFLAMPITDVLLRLNDALPVSEGFRESMQELDDKSNHLYGLMLHANTGLGLIANLLIVGLAAAIGEELFFRGILLRVIANSSQNNHTAVWISSIVFALFHLQPLKIVPMIFLAVVLGYLYVRTGSLWVTILVHALNNSIVVILDWSTKMGYNWAIASEDFEFSPFVIAAASAAFIGVFILFWRQSNEIDFSYDV